MKTLIVEDDFTSRVLLQQLLGGFGPTHVAISGPEAIEALAAAHTEGDPYDLVCLDIMLPGSTGHEALLAIRDLENGLGAVSRAAKIVMTTSLGDKDSILGAFRGQCDAYLVKPIGKAKLLESLQKLGLLEVGAAKHQASWPARKGARRGRHRV